MIEDVVRELGYLTLGSPLKRVDERLQGHAQALLEAAVADACAGAKGPLLTQLAVLEDALAASPFSRRAAHAA